MNKQLNPKAIEILRNRMSKKERVNFCREFGMNREPDNTTIRIMFLYANKSFSWVSSKQKHEYWDKIHERFTTEELSTPLYI